MLIVDSNGFGFSPGFPIVALAKSYPMRQLLVLSNFEKGASRSMIPDKPLVQNRPQSDES
jgi:hypothetical protein